MIRPSHTLRVAVVLAVALVAPALAAQPANVSATSTTSAERRADNENGLPDDDHFGLFLQRLTIGATAGSVTAQARADGALFAARPSEDYEDDLRLERLSFVFRGESWTLTAGDFYRQLGRGLALSLRKVDEAALDITIQGGQVELDASGHRASAFVGRANPVNLDAITDRHVEDTNDVLAGASYGFVGWRALQGGVHAVYGHPSETILGQRSTYATLGAWLELPALVDALALYVEVDAQHRSVLGQSCDPFAGDCQGLGAYLTIDLAVGPAVFLVEGLFLDSFEQPGSQNTALGQSFAYNQPPTLERIDQEIVDQHDVLGGHAHAELYFGGPDLLAYVDGVVRRNEPDGPAPVDTAHGFGGAETTWQIGRSRLALGGGYRLERQHGETYETMVHGEADLRQWLGDAWSLHLQSLHESRTLYARAYVRGSGVLGVDWAGVGAVAFELGYDTQNPSASVRDLFACGTVLAVLAESAELHMLAGTRRGGIRCVSGVCRELPAFAGARADLVVRY